MRVPAKLVFSAKYRSNGIFGALGLSDHGFCRASDMVQVRAGRGVEHECGGTGFEVKKKPRRKPMEKRAVCVTNAQKTLKPDGRIDAVSYEGSGMVIEQ